MKFPKHILLDLDKNNPLSSSSYWIYRYFINNFDKFNELQNFKKAYHLIYNPSANVWNKSNFRLTRKYTIFYNNFSFDLLFSSIKDEESVSRFINKKYNVNNKLRWVWKSKKWKFDKYFLPLKWLKKEKFSHHSGRYFKKNQITFKDYKLWSLFDINFLRKEPLYTKLKYSRTPQYDIVSGGSAALLSSFLGFLICERFGFELLDSGDFYYLFMYVVITCFSCRLLIKHTTTEQAIGNIFSFRWLYFFTSTAFLVFIKFINKIVSWK